MSSLSQLRAHVLAEAGASQIEVSELLACNKRRFGPIDVVEDLRFPLPDESFAELWEGYCEEVASHGTIEPLASHIPQLRFPIRAGISSLPSYRAATTVSRYRPDSPVKCELQLKAPDKCRLFLHRTPSGRLPVLLAENRKDFVALAQALIWNNEPVDILSTADCFAVSKSWKRAADGQNPGPKWDRFLIVSADSDSEGCAPAGISKALWTKRSTLARCEHGSAHYFSCRVLGSMRKLPLDEVVAHFYGMVCAFGKYRAHWLIDSIGCREAGWVEHYRGDPPLSGGAMTCMARILDRIAPILEAFSEYACGSRISTEVKVSILLTLFGFSLEELATSDSLVWLHWEFERQMNIRRSAGSRCAGAGK